MSFFCKGSVLTVSSYAMNMGVPGQREYLLIMLVDKRRLRTSALPQLRLFDIARVDGLVKVGDETAMILLVFGTAISSQQRCGPEVSHLQFV